MPAPSFSARHARWSIAALALSLSPIASAQNCDGWSAIGDPAGRIEHAMAYDSARGNIVMFGGRTDLAPSSTFSFNNETWEFNGSRWLFRTFDGPPPHAAHAMAYDSDRQVTVLFGGWSGVPYTTPSQVSDLWEWNGTAWTQRTPAGSAPGPRILHAMAYDPARHQTVMYGGVSGGNLLSDMWTWNGTAWSQRQPPAQGVWPGTIYSPSMAYDPITQRTILVGASATSNTFAWDGTTWSLLPSIPSSSELSITFDVTRARIIAVSRSAGSPTYELHPDGWHAAESSFSFTLPGLIACHESSGTTISLGPPTPAPVFEYQMRLTPGGWTPHAAPPQPKGAYDPVMAYDPDRGVAVLFGGGDGTPGTSYHETWQLRGERWTHRQTGGIPGTTEPAARYGAGMAYNPILHKCILRAGAATTDTATWYWDGAQWTTQAITGGPVSSDGDMLMTFDGARNLMVLIDRGSLLWDLQPTGWSQYTLPVGNMAFCYDPQRQVCIGAGGSSGSTYVFNNRVSTLLTTSQTSYSRPMMTYDHGRAAQVLFGGLYRQNGGAGFPQETFVLPSSATAWTQLPIRGPGGRKFAAFTYDPLAQRVVMFGGSNHSAVFRETWKLARGPAAIAAQPAPAVVPFGTPVTLSVVASGGGTIEYQWRHNTVPIQDGPGISGAATESLSIQSVSGADVGAYDVIVRNPCGQQTSAPVAVGISCTPDFDTDGDAGTDADIEAFFACLGGNCCPTCASADFNGDGDTGTDSDIESFFRVLAGGPC